MTWYKIAQSDPISQEELDKWINLIGNNDRTGVDYYDKCPEEIRDTKEIQDAWAESWFKKVKMHPTNYFSCPDKWKKLSNIRDTALKGFTHFLNQDPFYYNKLPPEFKELHEIKELAKKGLIKEIEKNNHLYDRCPDEFKSIPIIRECGKRWWIKQVDYPHHYEKCPPEFKDLPEIKDALIMGYANQFSLHISIYNAAYIEDFLKFNSVYSENINSSAALKARRKVIKALFDKISINPNSYYDLRDESERIHPDLQNDLRIIASHLKLPLIDPEWRKKDMKKNYPEEYEQEYPEEFIREYEEER